MLSMFERSWAPSAARIRHCWAGIAERVRFWKWAGFIATFRALRRNLLIKLQRLGFIRWFRISYMEIRSILTNPNKTMPVWLALHDPIKAFEDTKPVLEALRGHGTSAIGVAGFCYGGKVAVELVKCGLVQAGVLLHPSFVTEDDMKEVNVPLAILGAENDNVSCPPKLVKRFKEILSARKIPNFAKIFPGVGHWWALRYNLTDKKAVAAAEEAHRDMLHWFD